MLDIKNQIMYRKNTSIFHINWIESLIYTQIYQFSGVLVILFILWFFFIKYILRYKIVVTLLNVRSHEESHSRIQYIIFKTVLCNCDFIITHLNSVMIDAVKIYNVDRNKIISFPIHPMIKPDCNITKKEARLFLGISEDAFVYCFFGNIRKYKGIHDLINAFNEIKDKKDVLLYIIGNPSDKNYVKYLYKMIDEYSINKYIHFIPKFIPDKLVQYYIKSCDIGVIPYETDNSFFPSSIFAFFQFGIPVITSEKNATKEVCGKYALYFKRSNVENLKNILIEVKNKRNNLVSLQEDLINIYFTYVKEQDNAAKKIIKIYRYLMFKQNDDLPTHLI